METNVFQFGKSNELDYLSIHFFYLILPNGTH